MTTGITMTDPQMVTCRICNLLVGWSPQKVEFVCIPCFDLVQIIHSKRETLAGHPLAAQIEAQKKPTDNDEGPKD